MDTVNEIESVLTFTQDTNNTSNTCMYTNEMVILIIIEYCMYTFVLRFILCLAHCLRLFVFALFMLISCIEKCV